MALGQSVRSAPAEPLTLRTTGLRSQRGQFPQPGQSVINGIGKGPVEGHGISPALRSHSSLGWLVWPGLKTVIDSPQPAQ